MVRKSKNNDNPKYKQSGVYAVGVIVVSRHFTVAHFEYTYMLYLCVCVCDDGCQDRDADRIIS